MGDYEEVSCRKCGSVLHISEDDPWLGYCSDCEEEELVSMSDLVEAGEYVRKLNLFSKE